MVRTVVVSLTENRKLKTEALKNGGATQLAHEA